VAKILVVGGAGYVGGYLTDLLLINSHDVRVYDKLLYEESYLKPVEFVRGDILDIEKLKPQLVWADVVIWLAAFVGDPACALNPELTMRTNVEAVKGLVNNFKGQIIFLSTCSVYGAQKGKLDEQSPLNPLSLYAESKIQAEQILLEGAKEVLIFRLGTLFGLSDTYARLRVDLVLNVLTIRAVVEKHMKVFGGQQFRPLLHVRDVATAILPNIQTKTSGIFNLHNENVTILELAQRINAIIPDVETEITESSFQDSRNYMVTSDKARKEFGFSPKWSIEDGIKEVAEVVQTGRIPNINLPRFSNALALGKIIG